MPFELFGGKRGNRNGYALAPSPDVPIVGQPFTISAFQITTVLTCHCRPGNPALLVTNTGGTQCPGCRKAYVVHGLQLVPGQGAHFNIGAMLPQQAASEETRDV